MNDDPFAELKRHRLTPEMRAVVPRKIQKRRPHFIMVPLTWVEDSVGRRAKPIGLLYSCSI